MNDERPTNFRKRRSYPRSGTGLPFRLLPYCLSPGAEARNFMSIVGKAIEPYGRTASFRCVAPGAHLGGVDDGCIEMLVIIRCPWANIIDRVRTESRVTVDGCIWYLPRFPPFPPHQLLHDPTYFGPLNDVRGCPPFVSPFLRRSLHRCEEEALIGGRASREEE